MTALEELYQKRESTKKKLATVQLPYNSESVVCWQVGALVGASGPTVKNYLNGNIGDYFLAEAIYKEFKKLKLTKK